MTAVLAMETRHAATRRRAAVLARAPVALIFLRGGRVDVRASHPAVPPDVETALLALLDELHADVFVPVRRARTVRAVQEAFSEVRGPFGALWGAIVSTLFAGLELRDAAQAAESLLHEPGGLPRDLWTGRLAAGRLGRESLPCWAAAFDARVQAALALARWPEAVAEPTFAPAQEAELIARALDADLAIMLAVDTLAARRSVRLEPNVSVWLARRAHEDARRVFRTIATPLYRDAEARGA